MEWANVTSAVLMILVFVASVIIGCYLLLSDFIRGLGRRKTPPTRTPRRISVPKPNPRPLVQSSHRKINRDVGP